VSKVSDLRLFTGIIRDVTSRKELEREVVEIASLEQRRIGQDLHDSVGQELTALNLLAGDLADVLRTDPADAGTLVERIVQGLQRSRGELRGVLQGLLPVAVETEGLMAALCDLAERTQHQGKVACTFDCPEPVRLADNLAATHLFLIAREAVHNAVKHARARHLRIRLEENHHLLLQVQDDGIGIGAPQTEKAGLGMHIMQNRAAIIGARLTVEAAQPNGTLMTCTWARTNHERVQDREARPDPDRR
jgi:signal transduction histidine kinase